MWKDPIVEEVRAVGDKLARESDYDFHRYCERLRERQKGHARERIARRPGKAPLSARKNKEAKDPFEAT